MDISSGISGVVDSFGTDVSPGVLIALLGAVLVSVLILNALLKRLIAGVRRRQDGSRAVWSNALLGAVSRPARAAVWLSGVLLALRLLVREWPVMPLEMMAAYLQPVRSVLLILIVTWFLLGLVQRFEVNLAARGRRLGKPLDPTAADAIGKLSRLVIVVLALLTLLQTLGVSIAGLLAFGGAAGIAVGFAAQSLVANLFGGLTIFATHIFRIGEDIIIPSSNLSGTVQHIGWRSTQVLGWDHRPFFVPNSLFNTSVIINYTRMKDRRINEYISVRYEDINRVADIVEAGNQMLAEHPEIAHDYWVLRFDSYGDFALRIFLEAYVTTKSYAEFMRVKQDVLLKLAAILREKGAQLAVPVSRLYVPENLPPARERSEFTKN